MKRPSGRAGMTLLEVLVSLAIFALAATGLGAAYVNALHAMRASTELARHAADWRLVRGIVTDEPNREIAAQDGDLRLGERARISWQVGITPTSVLDLFEVDIRGELHDESGQALAHHEVFRVLRPTWSVAADRAAQLAAARQHQTGNPSR